MEVSVNGGSTAFTLKSISYKKRIFKISYDIRIHTEG